MSKLTGDHRLWRGRQEAIDRCGWRNAGISTIRCSLSLLATFLLLALTTGQAQQRESRDSIPTHRLDSIGTDGGDEVVEIDTYASQFDPRKAMLYSAIFPGGGQMYNKAYWKVPIIWGGFIALGYTIGYYQTGYVFYKDMLYSVLNEPAPLVFDPATGVSQGGNRVVNGKVVSYEGYLSIETLRQQVNRYQRNRDYTVLLISIWYILQMVEAHVDAHLKEFKVNPQLKVMVEPSINNSYMTGRTSGVALTLKF